MKRPFAVLGFTMLFISPLLFNMQIKTTVAMIFLAIVVFLFLLPFKRIRKDRTALYAIFAVVIFSLSFLNSQHRFFNIFHEYNNKNVSFEGVVSQTPRDTDYSWIYVINVNNVNDKKENFKVRYVSKNKQNLKEGDMVKGSGTFSVNDENTDFMESDLSSKIYFTLFNDGDNKVNKTYKENVYYKYMGSVKRCFTSVINTYLPNEYGSIAKAMVIGDKDGISRNVKDNFGYSGTAHLLVVSGLHLTMWSMLLITILMKFERLRKFSGVIGILGVIFYSALTGFNVSVIRAGTMIIVMLIARECHRDADSINSIGIALSFMLLSNPFSAFSLGLWFSVLSTTGILLSSNAVRRFVYDAPMWDNFKKFRLFRFIIDTFSISISTTLFTLPVFIFKVKMIPIFSFLSNFLMINVAMILMVLTFLGFLFHILHIFPLAHGIYIICGLLSKFLLLVAQKIGQYEWSTISVNHKLYTYLFVFSLIVLFITIILKKHKIDIIKHSVMLVTVITILTMTYCTVYEYSTPTIESYNGKNGIISVVKSGSHSILIVDVQKEDINSLKKITRLHNIKKLDYVINTNINNRTQSNLLNIKNNFGEVENISPYENNIDNVTVNGNIKVKFLKENNCIHIICRNKDVLILKCSKDKIVFPNDKKYDIIITCNNTELNHMLKDEKSFCLNLKKGEKASVSFIREKIKWQK